MSIGGRRCARRRPRRPALLVVLATLLPTVASAASARVTFASGGHPPRALIGIVANLSGSDHNLAPDLLAATQPAGFRLADANQPTVRQAVAHAFGCWWAWDDHGGVLYQRDADLPLGALQTRAYPVVDRGSAGQERLVRELMRPWLARPGAGLGIDADGTQWVATLDGPGHARLEELLVLLDHPQADAPSLLPDPDRVDEARRLAGPVQADDWPRFAEALSLAAGATVAIGPELGDAASPLLLPVTTLAELPARIARLGAQARWIHGALCIGAAAPVDREVPGQRRRLALLPVGHLIADPAEAELLATLLRTRVLPEAWRWPGTALLVHAPTRSLLIAADVPTIHAVMDALGRVDALGMEAAARAPEPAR